ncbi:Secretion-regulating guanine nucleotide exchange factor [Mycena venus]|uniref:Secretion-regulating guanine nucleotide exchange factor n=1 Tax=Mycena venus TaxID=2733690 RepID=A0A8H6XTL7_9AGAR|nr:Secretion-regulating guanine nucleotide exchange factor [Mycena venus]
MLLSAGSNAHGQLSNTSLEDSHFFSPCSFSGCSPGILPAGWELLHLASGANHTLALLKSHQNANTELWGCGDGKSGQLGPSYQAGGESSMFRPLDLSLERHGLSGYLPRLVAASWETTYVVLSRGDVPDVVIAMGANDFGDLGIGAKRAGKLPAKDIHIVQFDHLTQNGVSVDSSSLFIETLAAGQHHVVARLKTTAGYLTVGWGTSRHGQLGDVEKPFISSPAVISPGRSDDGIVSAALGHQHTVFLYASGTVSGIGSNRKHQLDSIDAAAGARSVACTWNGTYITIDDEDDAWGLLSAGDNAKGQLGRDDDGHRHVARVEFPFTPATHRLLQIACGSEHVLTSFFVLASSTTEVWGWGWNEHGNMGIGTTQDVRLPVKIWPPQEAQAQSGRVGIWAGAGTSWIVVQ